MLCHTPLSWWVVVGSSNLIPSALGLAFAIHLSDFETTIDNLLEAPIAFTTYSTCQASLSSFSQSYFYIPYISLLSFGIILVFLSVLRICLTNIRLVMYQWRLFALFLTFVFIALLASTYAISIPFLQIQNEITDAYICVASHPEDWSECLATNVFNSELDLFVNIMVSLFPVVFCTIAFLSSQWFWKWWMSVLRCRRPPIDSSDFPESESLSSRATTREADDVHS
jgi:hypothetical protein